MQRRDAAALERDATESLHLALTSLSIPTRVPPDGLAAGSVRGGAMIEVGSHTFRVGAASVVTAVQGERLALEGGADEPTVLVADRIAGNAKSALRRAGMNFYDQRGDLHLVDPPLIIDTTVPAWRGAHAPAAPLSGGVVKEVAIVCLSCPDQRHGVREVARRLGRAPSAVSKAMATLRSEGLITSAGEPVCPDLFHELASVWHRGPVVALAGLPDADRRLRLGIADPERSTGWALTDTLAAASWGVPIVARGDHPPDFYVPSEATMRAACSLLGVADNPRDWACTVAVAPVRLVCQQRIDHSGTSGEQWPVANHIVVALDLAQDKARGAEALDQWRPEAITRVW